jgi:hypothetical protein
VICVRYGNVASNGVGESLLVAANSAVGVGANDAGSLEIWVVAFVFGVRSWGVSSVIDVRCVECWHVVISSDISSCDVASTEMCSDLNNVEFVKYSGVAFGREVGLWDVSSIIDVRCVKRIGFWLMAFGSDVHSWEFAGLINKRYVEYSSAACSDEMRSWCVANIVVHSDVNYVGCLKYWSVNFGSDISLFEFTGVFNLIYLEYEGVVFNGETITSCSVVNGVGCYGFWGVAFGSDVDDEGYLACWGVAFEIDVGSFELTGIVNFWDGAINAVNSTYDNPESEAREFWLCYLFDSPTRGGIT